MLLHVFIYPGSLTQARLELQLIKDFSDHGSLHDSFLSSMKNLFQPDTFIETGTFLAYTTVKAAKIFPRVHTMELSASIYEQAALKLKPFSNVTPHLGDSADILPSILSGLNGIPLFWLDGHYSGNHYRLETGFGKKNTPIIEELESIARSNVKNAIILIDDIRYFDTFIVDRSKSIRGYPSLEEIRELLYSINSNYLVYVLWDALIAYPNTYNIAVSEIVRACTLSRFYKGTNGDLADVFNAEQVIAECEGFEKETLNQLYEFIKREPKNVGRHYILWEALIALHNNSNEHAYKLLKDLVKHPAAHWRIKWYLAQACKKLNLTREADTLLNELTRDYPNWIDLIPIPQF